MLPSKICRIWISLQVWNPLECAEIPRMACMLTGRPIILSCLRPALSVHGISEHDFLFKCRMGQFRGNAPDRVAGNTGFFRHRVGGILLGKEPVGEKFQRRARPCVRRPV